MAMRHSVKVKDGGPSPLPTARGNQYESGYRMFNVR